MRCFHPCHAHPGEKACAAITVSGPPSLEGKAFGDGYIHVGRIETRCGCPGLEQGVVP